MDRGDEPVKDWFTILMLLLALLGIAGTNWQIWDMRHPVAMGRQVNN